MIPVTVNIPLALCSVVLRRFIDSYTGRLPISVASRSLTSTPTLALFSGALLCLYHQLRRGTLVKVGLTKTVSSIIKNSRHTIQRRIKNKSWFLRNVDACRRKCTEAMLRIAHNSNDSIKNIRDETGTLTDPLCSSTFKHNESREVRPYNKQHDQPQVENLYSNNSFDVGEESYRETDVSNTRTSKNYSNLNAWDTEPTVNRPITRNLVKNRTDNGHGDWRKRILSKKRKKEDATKEEFSRCTPKAAISDQGWTQKTRPKIIRRHSERIGRPTKLQKITRKTRSGRVYAYRL